MNIPKITLDIDAIAREIDTDIKVTVGVPRVDYVVLEYVCPELSQRLYFEAHTDKPVPRDTLPWACENTAQAIAVGKARIAKTVAFIREHGPEAYYAVTSGTPK